MSKPKNELTEREFLAQQSAYAKEAMSRVLAEMRANLRHGVDVRLWAREYPWITAGSAAAAGLLAALALVPSKEQQALRKLAELQETIGPEPRGDGPPRRERSMLGVIGAQLLGALQPTIANMVSSRVTGRETQHEAPEPQSAGEAASTSAADI